MDPTTLPYTPKPRRPVSLHRYLLRISVGSLIRLRISGRTVLRTHAPHTAVAVAEANRLRAAGSVVTVAVEKGKVA